LTFAERVSALSLNGGFGADVVDFSQQLLSTSCSWGALVPGQSVAATESDEELKIWARGARGTGRASQQLINRGANVRAQEQQQLQQKQHSSRSSHSKPKP
jgi:hypothetical protein